MRCTPAVIMLLSAALSVPAHAQFTVVSFDDLPGVETAIPDGYQGLVWDNFFSRNTCDVSPDYNFCAGTITPPNVAINGGGNPASIRAVGGIPFHFLIGSYGSGTNYDMRLELEGFLNGTRVHTLGIDLEFNSINAWSVEWLVDEVRFSASVDDADAPAGTPTRFTLDELYYAHVVPEPASLVLLLTGLAFAWAAPFCRRILRSSNAA